AGRRRGPADRAPGGPGGGGGLDPGRRADDGEGVRRLQACCTTGERARRRAARVLRRAAAPLPGPAADRVRGRSPEDRYRQDPALQAARTLMLGGKPLVDARIHLAQRRGLKLSWERWVMDRRADGNPAELYEE